MKPRTVSMAHRKLMSIIQVEYLGSSEPDLRSGSAKTTLAEDCCEGLRTVPKKIILAAFD